MENFKIEHFKKDNPSETFPRFSSLNSSQAKSIRLKLSERLVIPSYEPEIITKEIDKTETDVQGDDANDDRFMLSTVLSRLGIQPKATVFMNWYRYDQIDEIDFADLNKYFVYVWYPGSDDIDIFDSSFSWILSVSHEGHIRFLRMS